MQMRACRSTLRKSMVQQFQCVGQEQPHNQNARIVMSARDKQNHED